MAGWTKVPRGMVVDPGPGDFAFSQDPASPPQIIRHSPTQFWAYVYCGQTAGWIKMPLGTEVNLGPGDVLLGGVADPPRRGTTPSFWFVCCGQTA